MHSVTMWLALVGVAMTLLMITLAMQCCLGDKRFGAKKAVKTTTTHTARKVHSKLKIEPKPAPAASLIDLQRTQPSHTRGRRIETGTAIVSNTAVDDGKVGLQSAAAGARLTRISPDSALAAKRDLPGDGLLEG